MSFISFLEKDVTAYPSGREVAEGKKTSAKYKKAIAGILAAGIAISAGTYYDSIAPWSSENYPTQYKMEVTTEYDSSLLSTIDSIYNTGVSMDVAVEKGVLLEAGRAAQVVRNDPPEEQRIVNVKVRDSVMEHKIALNHAQQRVEDARDTVQTDSGTVFVYKADFRDQLASEIDQNAAKLQKMENMSVVDQVSASVQDLKDNYNRLSKEKRDDGEKHRELSCRAGQNGVVGVAGILAAGAAKEVVDFTKKVTNEDLRNAYGGVEGVVADGVKDMKNNVNGSLYGFLHKYGDCGKWSSGRG